MVGYLFGGNTGDSYQSLQRRRQIADALAAQVMGSTPKNTGEGIGAVLKGIGAGIGRYRADKALDAGTASANSAYDSIFGKLMGAPSPAGNGGQTIPAPSGSDIGLSPSKPIDMNGNQIFNDFIGTVKSGGVENPYALAAIAATGKAESGYDPGNVNRSWSDPSESGKAGTAGGIMSWRGPRLASLQAFAQSKGEQGNGSPATQGEFLLREDPSLIAKLNNAGSVQEAQQLMNNAWAFKGYNRPGGESARRMGLASSFLPTFQGQGGNQVASLDSSIGMPAPEAQAAIEATAPGSGYVDPRVTTYYRRPQPQQMPPQSGAGNALPPLPSTNVGPAPAVAGVPPQASQQPPQQVAQAGPFGGVDPQLLGLLSNPFLDDEKKGVIRMLVQQQMQAQQNAQEQLTWQSRQDYQDNQRKNDPGYRIDLKYKQSQIDRMNRPGYRVLSPEERSQLGIPDTDKRVYQQGPEGQIDAVGGAGQTINVGGQIEARKAAAEQLGLKPDDPRYMGYVLNGELPKENQQQLTAVDKKAIQEADDMVAANQNAISALGQAEGLSDKANAGWFAGTRASIGNNLPDWAVPDFVSSPESSQATTDMDNAIVGQALTQLKTIFGGNPTEGERAILLQLQGSSSMPANVRKQVFARARELAEKRLQFNQDRANDLRGGNYYKPDRGGTPAAPTGPSVDDLLKKYGGQ